MDPLIDAVDDVAVRTGFSGVVRVDRDGRTELATAYGLADRAHAVPNTLATQFATASATKTFTAVAVLRLVADGVLSLGTTARSLLGADLPLVADDVTVEHLLAHRSGIGDYVDEEAVGSVDAYVMPVPVHQLTTTESYLPVLDGHPTVFRAGERYAYNNSGYVLLALLAERASGTSFADLVRTLVCDPAGLRDTAFLRSDELPGRAARGYLSAEGLRSNVLHLPVVGSGDGGLYSTVADLGAFWDALLAGRMLPADRVAEMLRPHAGDAGTPERHGLGVQLHPATDEVWMEGHDAGVSCISAHRPSTSTTWTVVSNWSDGAWPVARLLRERLAR